MKYMILLYDNADMREISASRSDLTEETGALLEEIRQSGELVATEPLADPVQTKTVRPRRRPRSRRAKAYRLLRECARAGDVVGRLGGDEFALLLVEQSAEGAASVADRLRSHVPARRSAIGSDVSWDLTVGTAGYPEDGETFETLLSAADRHLYAQRGIQLGMMDHAPALTAAATGA